MSQKEDMEAVKRFFASQKPQTSKAVKLKDEFITWYDSLNWYEVNVDGAAWDKARNLRNEYNRANAVTDAQERAVEQHIKGVTTEEAEGDTSRQLSGGYYEEPLISDTSKVKLAGAAYVGGLAVVIGVVGVAAFSLLRMYLPYHFISRRY